MFPFHLAEKTIFSLDSAPLENNRAIGSSGTHTGITNAVRTNETINDQLYPRVESTPSTMVEKREGENVISLAESQFYARTSKGPDLNDNKETIDHVKKVIPEEIKIIQKQEIFINEPVNG
jgi:hypothetical protein